MKFIRNHLMFILPLMAILLGIEFYLVFERTTNTYEKGLKEGYTMLAVAKKPMELSDFQALNDHISSAEKIEREAIVSEVAKGVSKSSSEKILAALPYFYNLGLDTYLHTSGLDEIKKELDQIGDLVDSKIEKAVLIIHLSKGNIRIQDLQRNLNVSKSTLERLFYRNIGRRSTCYKEIC